VLAGRSLLVALALLLLAPCTALAGQFQVNNKTIV
jgi:hypothetical protein